MAKQVIRSDYLVRNSTAGIPDVRFLALPFRLFIINQVIIKPTHLSDFPLPISLLVALACEENLFIETTNMRVGKGDVQSATNCLDSTPPYLQLCLCKLKHTSCTCLPHSHRLSRYSP